MHNIVYIRSPFQKGGYVKTLKRGKLCVFHFKMVGLSNPGKRGKSSLFLKEVTLQNRNSYHGNLLCEPNLVGSRISSLNPEFLSISSPFLKYKRCFNTSFIHSCCKIAFLTEYLFVLFQVQIFKLMHFL